jgi:hypothetical protein
MSRLFFGLIVSYRICRPGVRRTKADCYSFAHHVSAQKNKATSYHLGQLKAKLAKLKRELISPSSGSGGGGGGIGFDVARFVRLPMEILDFS